jgi:hypothetical protein
MTNNIFTFHISETDALFFKPNMNEIEIFNKHEGSDEIKIATYYNGKWSWSDEKQRSLFFFLMKSHPKEFQRAIKFYRKSLEVKPMFYIFTCAKRKFFIKINKLIK